MFIVSQFNARPLGVLLGGSGICETVVPEKPDIGALLRPCKSYADRETSGTASALAVDALRKMNRNA